MMAMPRRTVELLSYGVFFIILAVCLIAFFPDWLMIFSMVLTFYGVWVMVLAGIRTKSPEKYERGAFSTFVWGILLAVIGGAWFVFIQTAYWVYSLALLLVVVGILAVVAALRSWRK